MRDRSPDKTPASQVRKRSSSKDCSSAICSRFMVSSFIAKAFITFKFRLLWNKLSTTRAEQRHRSMVSREHTVPMLAQKSFHISSLRPLGNSILRKSNCLVSPRRKAPANPVQLQTLEFFIRTVCQSDVSLAAKFHNLQTAAARGRSFKNYFKKNHVQKCLTINNYSLFLVYLVF